MNIAFQKLRIAFRKTNIANLKEGLQNSKGDCKRVVMSSFITILKVLIFFIADRLAPLGAAVFGGDLQREV